MSTVNGGGVREHDFFEGLTQPSWNWQGRRAAGRWPSPSSWSWRRAASS